MATNSRRKQVSRIETNEPTKRRNKFTCVVIVENSAYAKAAVALGRTEDELRRALADLGRSVSGPWRAEEKLAALAAWMR